LNFGTPLLGIERFVNYSLEAKTHAAPRASNAGGT